MLNSFFQSICQVGIFVICAQTIVHFRAQESYEKYIKLLVGIMVLLQLFLPVGGYLLGKGGQETAEVFREFRHGLEEGMKNAEEKAAAADKLLEQMTLEELRRRMEEQNGSGNPQEEGAGSTEGMPGMELWEEPGLEEQDLGGSADEEGITVEMDPIEPVTIGGAGGETD